MSFNPRKSFASLGVSSAQSQSAGSNIKLRIEEKQREYDYLLRLKSLSSGLLQQLQALESSISDLAVGSEEYMKVLDNWKHVFRAIQISARSDADTSKDNDHDDNEGHDDENRRPDCLVRIPIEMIDDTDNIKKQ